DTFYLASMKFQNNERLPISVVLIEDDKTIREGFAYLISNEPGYYVRATYASAEDALPHLAADLPDVILLDIQLPGMSGLEALPKIKALVKAAHVLLLTVYDDEENVFRALSLGASGYLTKSSSARKIIAAIEEVMEGGAPLSANVAKLVIRSFHKNTAASPLTKRETEILERISEGKSRTKIAQELFIDVETVKTHIKNIYDKLDVHSREDAIRTAKDKRFI
ncbi:MAG: response regulator transcription factor, partial [Bacteroidota bacterium]